VIWGFENIGMASLLYLWLSFHRTGANRYPLPRLAD